MSFPECAGGYAPDIPLGKAAGRQAPQRTNAARKGAGANGSTWTAHGVYGINPCAAGK